MAASRGSLSARIGKQDRAHRDMPAVAEAVPPSPTLTATTAASQLDLGDNGPPVVITRADLRASIQAQENLLVAAKGYRNSMLALSNASTVFASALEECARVKGAGESGDHLLAASGLQYMVANSGQVLSDTLYRSFEVPLMHAYDAYVSVTASRHAEYECLLAERTAAIRQTEADNLRQGRKKSRDLAQFRRALERLQEQVREVEAVKGSYYSEVLDSEEEMWDLVKTKVALVIRSTLDLSDRLASKATADPLVESMLNEHPDPFDSYRPQNEKEERGVFTVLPPLGMNLGMGIGGGSGAASVTGSRKGSVADLDLYAGGQAQAQESVLTPRQSRSKVPSGILSPSEVLGIDEVADEDVQTPRRAVTLNGKPSSSRARSTSADAMPTTSQDTDASSISSVSTSPRSASTDGEDDQSRRAAAEGESSQSQQDSNYGGRQSATTSSTQSASTGLGPDSPSPARTSTSTEASSSDRPLSPVTRVRSSLFRSPVKSRKKATTKVGKNGGKSAAEEARLSRVSEDPAMMVAAESADVMAGDWSTGVNDEGYAYSRGIATGLEDDGGWDSG